MLAFLFWVLLVASVSAMAVIWVLAIRLASGIVSDTRAGRAGASLLLAVAWPFGLRHRAGVPADKAASLNKMLVSLFIASLIAIASMAVYSNLTLVLPAPKLQ